MSLIAYARCVSPFEIAAIKRNPATAASLATTGTLAGLGARRPNLLRNIGLLREGGGTGVLASAALQGELDRQIEEANAAMSAGSRARAEAEPSRVLDLHKSWHVLHYLFTGQADGGTPPADALMGGREFGADMGYGPPRLHEPAAATAFARFLAPLTVAELQRRIDIARMSALGIYCCEDHDASSAEELDNDLPQNYPLMQEFVAGAAKDGNGLLVWLG
jgi:hypothetical protein